MKPDFLQICILATESCESPPFTTISLPLFSPPLPIWDGQEAGLQLSLNYMCTGWQAVVPWTKAKWTHIPLWDITSFYLYQRLFHKTCRNLVSLILMLSCNVRSKSDNGFKSSRESAIEKKTRQQNPNQPTNQSLPKLHFLSLSYTWKLFKTGVIITNSWPAVPENLDFCYAKSPPTHNVWVVM